MVEGLIEEAVVGKTYTGPVKRIMDFGAFVEILPGKEGLVHISKLAAGRVENVSDVVHEGQELTVTVTEIDHMGRINLATKEALDANPALLTEHAERRPPAPGRRQAPQRRLPRRPPQARAASRTGRPAAMRDRAAGPVPRGEMGDPHGKTGERSTPAPGAGRPHGYPLHRVLVSPRLAGRRAEGARVFALPRAHALQGDGPEERALDRAGDRPCRRHHQRLHGEGNHLRLRHHSARAPAARLRRSHGHDDRLPPRRGGVGEGEGGHRQRDPFGGRFPGGEGTRPLPARDVGRPPPRPEDHRRGG